MPLLPGASAVAGNLPMDVMYFGLLRLEGSDLQVTAEQAPVVIDLLELRNRYMYIVTHEAQLVDEVLDDKQKEFLASKPYSANPDEMVPFLWKANVGKVRDVLRKTAGVARMEPIPLPDARNANFQGKYGPSVLAHFLRYFFELESDAALALTPDQARALLPSFERHWLILPERKPHETIATILTAEQKMAVDRIVNDHRNQRVHLLEDARTLYRILTKRVGHQ